MDQEILNSYSRINHLNVSRETFLDFENYISMILEKNKKINIISQNTASKKAIIDRHIIDSAQIIDFVDLNSNTTTDIGSGGGMPGIIVAIILKNMKNNMNVHLYEKSYHKSHFLKEVSKKLNLNTKVFQKNIFEIKNLETGTIMSRAFKPMPVILNLVNQNFLCEPTSYTYDVNLGALRVGINGDYTVSSSERLYGGFDMQEKLITAYRERAQGKKILIFNPGIRVSWMVYDMFKENGIDHIKHLDSTFSDQERRDTLSWFRNTPNAVLTSVGILTTGFDEPSVETIVLNRATRSLTLYHQMIGRGSRVTPTKKSFNIIDLGNNIHRFGLWEAPLDWHDVFNNPDKFLDQNYFDELEKQRELNYTMPDEVIELFPTNTEDLFLDVEDIYEVVRIIKDVNNK